MNLSEKLTFYIKDFGDISDIFSRPPDREDVYDLDRTLATYTYGWISYFKEVKNSYPSSLTKEEWDEILDKILNSLRMVACPLEKEEEKDLAEKNEGLQLLVKYFEDLWI